MTTLNFDHFEDYFKALWDEKEAFAWQKELAKRVIGQSEQPWPECIQLPTASGKTACIDIAVFALAAQVERLNAGQMPSLPRRIFFVVDRRVIVDEAFERAKLLADKLKNAPDGILKQVADRLRKLSGTDTPLAAFQLRGGMYRSNAWAKNPVQPTIVASTVDQLGSRLLFRAYGPGTGTWPIHAGLAGNDVLILLDEAHCAQPFLETLRAVDNYRRWGDSGITPPFYVTVMSATPPEGMTDIFKDKSDEARTPDHPLGKRQLAAKPTALFVSNKATGSKASDELAADLAKKAEELVAQYGLQQQDDTQKDLFAQQTEGKLAVVIFCNRVATARATWRLLAKKHGEAAILLTGRMRPIDKDDTVQGRLAELSADCSQNRKLDKTVFVVTTQTLEVGANLDFDLLVTECASLDALRQRFGRLNRMGRPVKSRAVVLIRADQAKSSDDDPVYGKALAETWAWLNTESNLDMGIAALADLLPEGEDLEKLNAPSAHAPVMLPAHIDCWSQTAPIPKPTPDVAVFLHGPGNRAADVQVCWRADLDKDLEQNTGWKEVLTLAPPSSPECLAVPMHLMRRWLEGEEAISTDVSDIEGEMVSTTENNKAIKRQVIRWRGGEEPELMDGHEGLRPGDVLVIPAGLGGWDTLGDLPRPNGEPVLDWGDRAHAQTRAKAQLRLHPSLTASWPECESVGRLRQLVADAQALYEEDADGLTEDLRGTLAGLAQEPDLQTWLKVVAGHLSDKSNRWNLSLHPFGGLIVQGKRPMPRVDDETDPFSDETDSAASGTARQQNLKTHLRGVARWARKFAKACGLPRQLRKAIILAALAHDLGKADPRFQAWLRGGIMLGGGATLLAKSPEMPQGRQESEKARARAGYPKGGRHELLSVRLLENCGKLMPEDEILRDLVLHLIASHHGHCRPFAPVIFDDSTPKVAIDWQSLHLEHQGPTGLEKLDSGVADRFWRLSRHFGWWGLAWLEAILRLADHRRSEWEENSK
jgi:CRISPR-associated endonuclease/helicase Cas3